MLDFFALLIGLVTGGVLASSLWAGIRGRLAPWVPTPQALVDAHLDAVGVGAGDTLVDVGCGDGRVLASAARRGARVLGLEIDPVWRAWIWLRWQGRIAVQGGDALAAPPPPARWIWVYGMRHTLTPERPLSQWLETARAQGSTLLVLRFPWVAGGEPTAVIAPPAHVTREAWTLRVYAPLAPTP